MRLHREWEYAQDVRSYRFKDGLKQNLKDNLPFTDALVNFLWRFAILTQKELSSPDIALVLRYSLIDIGLPIFAIAGIFDTCIRIMQASNRDIGTTIQNYKNKKMYVDTLCFVFQGTLGTVLSTGSTAFIQQLLAKLEHENIWTLAALGGVNETVTILLIGAICEYLDARYFRPRGFSKLSIVHNALKSGLQSFCASALMIVNLYQRVPLENEDANKAIDSSLVAFAALLIPAYEFMRTFVKYFIIPPSRVKVEAQPYIMGYVPPVEPVPDATILRPPEKKSAASSITSYFCSFFCCKKTEETPAPTSTHTYSHKDV